MEAAPLWAALLVMPLVLAAAQREVGGIYSQRTRWDRAGAPYVASSDVVITETGEVEVEPGVVVKFRPGIGVTVRGGRLVAQVSSQFSLTVIHTTHRTLTVVGPNVRDAGGLGRGWLLAARCGLVAAGCWFVGVCVCVLV